MVHGSWFMVHVYTEHCTVHFTTHILGLQVSNEHTHCGMPCMGVNNSLSSYKFCMYNIYIQAVNDAHNVKVPNVNIPHYILL